MLGKDMEVSEDMGGRQKPFFVSKDLERFKVASNLLALVYICH
jgi:hypothetical protein